MLVTREGNSYQYVLNQNLMSHWVFAICMSVFGYIWETWFLDWNKCSLYTFDGSPLCPIYCLPVCFLWRLQYIRELVVHLEQTWLVSRTLQMITLPYSTITYYRLQSGSSPHRRKETPLDATLDFLLCQKFYMDDSWSLHAIMHQFEQVDHFVRCNSV